MSTGRMVIVQGVFGVPPGEGASFLDARVEVIRRARDEDGCLDYVMAADPADPGRVIISERWESMDHLQRHLDRLSAPPGEPGRPALPPPLSAEITVYEVASSRRLR